MPPSDAYRHGRPIHEPGHDARTGKRRPVAPAGDPWLRDLSTFSGATALSVLLLVTALYYPSTTAATVRSGCYSNSGCGAPPGGGPPPGEVLFEVSLSTYGPEGNWGDLVPYTSAPGFPGGVVDQNFSVRWSAPNGSSASGFVIEGIHLVGANLSGTLPSLPLTVEYGQWIALELAIRVPDLPGATIYVQADLFMS
jgi:hypothetical protein